jgi:transcriptional regulator with XRE-family HTH domain
MSADMTADELGTVVRNRREQLKITQSEAARRAGLGRTTWIEIEQGKRPQALPATLDRIDEALEWEPGTLRSLLGRTTPGAANYAYASTNALRQELIAFSSTLSGAQVEQVVRFIHTLVATGTTESEVNIHDTLTRAFEQIANLTDEVHRIAEQIGKPEDDRPIRTTPDLL